MTSIPGSVEQFREREQEFDDPAREYRRIFAEVWGTFLLVLVAAGCGVVAAQNYGGELAGPISGLAAGVTVACAILFLGDVSGAHLNPAVTLAFSARGNFPWSRVPGYLLAQFAGAMMAALTLQWIFGGVLNGATEPAQGVPSSTAAIVEMLLTLGLVSVVLGTAAKARNLGTNAALAVGGYIGLVTAWGAPVTGASMNPMRSFAPDLVGADLSHYWIYMVGPLTGAALAVIFEFVLKGRPKESGDIAAQGEPAGQ